MYSVNITFYVLTVRLENGMTQLMQLMLQDINTE